MERVLLPADGGPHVHPAADLAAAVARSNAASVTIVSYVPEFAGETERDRVREHAQSAAEHISQVPVDETVREAEDVSGAIVSAATDHDLVVLGATREGGIRNQVVGSVAEAIGERAAPPVVVIAKRRSEESLLARALEPWWR